MGLVRRPRRASGGPPGHHRASSMGVIHGPPLLGKSPMRTRSRARHALRRYRSRARCRCCAVVAPAPTPWSGSPPCRSSRSSCKRTTRRVVFGSVSAECQRGTCRYSYLKQHSLPPSPTTPLLDRATRSAHLCTTGTVSRYSFWSWTSPSLPHPGRLPGDTPLPIATTPLTTTGQEKSA